VEDIIIILIAAIFALRYLLRLQARGIFTILLVGLIGFFFSFTVAEMPPFGDPTNPVFNEVPAHYIEMGLQETGAVNLVSSIIIDYRAFDTLGEATVLFVAIAAVIATLKSH